MFICFETNRKQLLTFSMLESFNLTSKSTLLQRQRQQQQSNTERQLRVMLNEERERSNIYEICIQPSGTQHHHNVVNQIDKKLGLVVFYLSFTVNKHFNIFLLTIVTCFHIYNCLFICLHSILQCLKNTIDLNQLYTNSMYTRSCNDTNRKLCFTKYQI